MGVTDCSTTRRIRVLDHIKMADLTVLKRAGNAENRNHLGHYHAGTHMLIIFQISINVTVGIT